MRMGSSDWKEDLETEDVESILESFDPDWQSRGWESAWDAAKFYQEDEEFQDRVREYKKENIA